MPHIKHILYGGICLLNATALIAQKTPGTVYLQQAVGRQLYQQKQWSMKQTPVNSAVYKFNRVYTQSHGLNFSTEKIRVSTISYPTFTGYSFNYSFRSAAAPDLQSLLQNRRRQDYKWQKQSWWKDPSKGGGAYLLRDFFLKDKNLLLF